MEGREKVKFLILGATGMAGHTIALYLLERGHEVTAFSRTPFPYCENINGDIMDQHLLTTILKKNYDVVINCIAVLREVCDKEPSRAVYLNSYLPHLLVKHLKNKPTKLIHMSTESVFSGKSAPYSENSVCDPVDLYGKTKALGEVNDTKNLTFRNSIIGPEMGKNGFSLFNWFMNQKGTIKGYSHALWSGVTTLTLAKAMERAAMEDLTGIYHLVNNTTITKLELLMLFNENFKTNEDIILNDSAVNVNKTLLNTRTDFSFNVPSYERMVIEMKEWIYKHKHLYPHYFKENRT